MAESGITENGPLKFVSELPGQWRYGALYRPIETATVPAGFVSTEPMSGKYMHRVVIYDRALSEQEVAMFELTPLLTDAQRAAVADAIAVDLEGYAKTILSLEESDSGFLRAEVAQRIGRADRYDGNLEDLVSQVRTRLVSVTG